MAAAHPKGPYASGLDRTAANYVPLTPLSFLKRTATVFPDKLAVVHGDLRRSYAELYRRSRQLASALHRRGIGPGDTVAVMAPNTPEALEAHFGVMMTGAVLNMINIRLDAETVAFILGHGEAKVLLTDREFSPTVSRALALVEQRPLVVDIHDPLAKGGEALGETDYESFIAAGDPDFAWRMPEDEWEACALNYTSGTTGNPKGVVYHHRGAYLNAVGNAMVWSMPQFPVYLWTLPMFHCNGWCFPWTVTAQAGVHVCLRQVAAKPIFDALADHGVTHMSGAPIVMNMMANARAEDRRPLGRRVAFTTAGAAPPAAVIEKMTEQGFDICHVYGLTEVYGPTAVCAWDPDWDDLPEEERSAIKARQGVPYTVEEDLAVLDPRTMEPVPQDGRTVGELMFRGNVVMKGYLKNPKATEEAFAGGWFHTGDLGVWHANGYAEIKDRSKDIVISGGENISTIEVEGVLYRHPAVLEAAVVAKPDAKWGETPCAFVTLKPGAQATAEEIIEFCRANMARYKVPKDVVFDDLPKTSTGKIQKFVLRERAKALEPEPQEA